MKKPAPAEEEIAKKHGVSVEHVKQQAESGVKFEREHVTTHKEAYEIALQHLDEYIDYYTKKGLPSMERRLAVREMLEGRDDLESLPLSRSAKEYARLSTQGGKDLGALRRKVGLFKRVNASISNPGVPDKWNNFDRGVQIPFKGSVREMLDELHAAREV